MRLFRTLLASLLSVGACIVVSSKATSAAASTAPAYYVSLGDSLAEGYQPGSTDGSETLAGYSNRVVADAQPKDNLTLENFGCGGATTTSMMESIGCGDLANNGVAYPTTTQLAAAIHFIDAHTQQIALVTIDIGGNDLLQNVANSTIVTNIQSIVAQLRAAVGPNVPILGIGYPDQTLADWLHGASGKALAKNSIAQVQRSIDPMFERAYAPSNVTFLDVAGAFGAFVSLKKIVTAPHYGKLPLAVARICQLTWGCATGDQHPTSAGYALIARRIVQAATTLGL